MASWMVATPKRLSLSTAALSARTMLRLTMPRLFMLMCCSVPIKQFQRPWALRAVSRRENTRRALPSYTLKRCSAFRLDVPST